MHSDWRAIKRVVEHGVLVEHDHDLDVGPDTGEVLACPEGCPFEQLMTAAEKARRREAFDAREPLSVKVG